MKTYKQHVKNLSKKFQFVSKSLDKKVNEIITTTNTTLKYWSKMKNSIAYDYERLRIITAKWVETDIPEYYKTSVLKNVRSINKKKLKPISKNLTVKDVTKKQLNKTSVQILQQDTLSTMIVGLNSGEKTINTMMLLTQQLLVQEYQINKAIQKGIQETGTPQGASKELYKSLLNKSKDGKYITIIDKNGNPRRYTLKSYSELVARTKLSDANTQATIQSTLAANGDLVQVSAHNTTTPNCIPFEGKVFSISGKNKDFPPLIDTPPFHPNCLHSLSATFSEGMQAAGTYDGLSEFSKGKTNVPPNRPSFIPNDDLAARIKNAKG